MDLYNEAVDITNNINNGCIEGTSPGKDGRAWLTGEFQLEELEALCYLIKKQYNITTESIFVDYK